MSRLVVISNRVPPVKAGAKAAAGGLAAAIAGALKSSGGLWFGWSGEVRESAEAPVTFRKGDNYTVATIDLTQEDIDEYYAGFANRTLWPLCHFRMNLVDYDRRFSVGYYR